MLKTMQYLPQAQLRGDPFAHQAQGASNILVDIRSGPEGAQSVSEYAACFVSLKVHFLKLVFFDVVFLEFFVGVLLNCNVLLGSGSLGPEIIFHFYSVSVIPFFKDCS